MYPPQCMHRGARPKVILRLNARTQNDTKFCLSAILYSACHRGEGRGERKQLESFFSCVLAGAYTTTSLVIVTLSMLLLLSEQDFQTRIQKNSLLVIVYSALFYIVIESLNLVLEKIQNIQHKSTCLAISLSFSPSIPQSSDMACHWRFP